jgi:putative transcriptional regulator
MSEPELKNSIHVHRAMKEWTQEELARRVGVTRKTINTIENNVFIPSTILALKIAKAFGVRVEDLFQLNDHKKR